MSASLKLILRVPIPLQHRRVNRAQHQIILRPGKVQQPQPVHVALVLGRQRHAVDRRLDVVARQEAQRVARVDRQAAVQRLGPLPLARQVVLDLQRGDGLAEQERDGAQVRVARGPQAVGELGDFVVVEFAVLHVPQVRLVVDVPPVHLGEEVGGELQREGDERVEGVEDFVMEVLRATCGHE